MGKGKTWDFLGRSYRNFYIFGRPICWGCDYEVVEVDPEKFWKGNNA